jgi:hypothetical protein
MAQVDPNIAMGFRPVQIPLEESPLNRMQKYADFENALVKSQELQRSAQQRNALSRIRASGLDIESPEYLTRVSQEAPDLADVETERQLKRLQLREAKQTADLKQSQLTREQLRTAKKELLALPNLDAALKDIYDGVQSGVLTAEQGEALRAGLPTDEAEFPKWQQKQLLGYLTVEQQLERQDKSNSAAYADYVMGKVINDPDAKLLSKAEFIASRNEAPTPAAPAVASAAAPAPADATVTTPPEAGTTVSAEGVLLAPGVAELYAADNPKAKAMADILQRRFEDKIKSQRFTGEFANVDIAEDRIAELKKRPQTPEVVAKIATLQDMIKTAKQGKAPKIDVNVGTQEKEFEKQLGGGQAKTLLESREKAEDARDILSTVKTGRDILKSGVITGAGADFFVGLNQALKTAGVDMGYADAAANSQAYAANMANNVGKLIKQFGAGTGLSDADRKYAEQMAGGRISLDKKALEKILDIQDRAARNVISRHNQKVKGVKTNIPLEVQLEETAAPPAAPKPKSDIRSKADAILGKP